MLTYCNSIVFWQLDFVSCNHAIRNGFTLFYISLLMVLLEVLCDFWWGWLCPFDKSLLFSFNHLLYISVILSDTCMMLIRLVILYQKCLHVLSCTLKTKIFSLSAMAIPCNITEVLPDETRIVNHTQEPIINWSTPWRNVNFKNIRCTAIELLNQSGFSLQHPTDMQNEVYFFFIFHIFQFFSQVNEDTM